MLSQIQSVTALLDEQKIDYVIWKSLENLDAQLEGREDIDILFKPEDHDKILGFLMDNDFALDITSPDTHGRELYILRGFDVEQSCFFTFHVHFGLFSGSKKYKEYRIPLEEDCFKSRVQKNGLWILDDHMFCITRFIVNAIRENPNDPVLDDLISKFDGQKHDAYKRIFSPFGLDQMIQKFADGKIKEREHIQRKIVDNLDRQNPIGPRIKYLDKMRQKRQGGWRHRLAVLVGLKRNKQGYGAGIMLVGHDGAGKSSSTQILTKRLRKLGAVKQIYLGRQNWCFLNRWIEKGRETTLSFFCRSLWPLTSTIEILYRYMKGKFFEKVGYIVIYDRTLYDIIIKWEGSPLKTARLACRLARFFAGQTDEKTTKIYLHCSAETAKKRKGKHEKEEIESLHHHYQSLLPKEYHAIDTSDLTPDEVCHTIIRKFIERHNGICKNFL